jgi:hypothetical protein
MKRILNYFRDLLRRGKLSEAIDRAYLYPAGHVIYEPVLVDYLDDTIVKLYPDLEYDLMAGVWYKPRLDTGQLTLMHSSVECQVAIAV